MIRIDRKIGGARLIVWETIEPLRELQKEIHHPLSLADFGKIKSDKKKSEFLGTRLALKKVFGEECYLSHHDSGKPFFADKNINISISHSDEWVALLLHPSKEPGVDIQAPNEKIERVYTRFLSEQEIENISEKGKNSAKYLLSWAAKEALYKIIGAEAVDFKNDMEIQNFSLQKSGSLNVLHHRKERNYIVYYEQHECYTLAYCFD